MSNDNDKIFARLWKLWAMICKMIMDGKRDARVVARILQKIVDGIPDAFSCVWKTVEIGQGPQTGAGLLSRHAREQHRIEGSADSVLLSSDFTVTSTPQKVDLVRLTVRQIGFNERTIYSIICRRAEELGLQLCPRDVAPQLLCQFETQPVGDYFFVASEPIACADGYSRILGLYRDEDKQALEGFYAYSKNPRDGFDPNHEFVFVLPKQGSDE